MTQRILPMAAAIGLVVASCAPHRSPQLETGRAKVLRACEAEFGPPVDQETAFFEVDRDFVLAAEFDDGGRLVRLAVQPKHWFGDAHPEWDESEDVGELSEAQYTSLLRRLDAILPRGRLVAPDEEPVVRGTTLERRDVYEHAVVVTGDVVDDTRSDDAPRAVKYLLVYPAAGDDSPG